MSGMKDPEKELEKLQREFDEFSYIISHDFKAHLRAIVNISEWIKEDMDGEMNEEVASHMKLLDSRISTVQLMMESLTAYSRVNRLNLNKEEIQFPSFMEEIVRQYTIQSDVKLTLKSASFTIITFKEKLLTVLHQLIENAIDHNPEEIKQIEINVVEKDKEVVFTIVDNGPGIEKEALGKIFNIFFSVSGNKQHIGVGLTLCKKIIDFVGGKIQVTSDLSKGTAVIFYWPK